jgi:histidyl-tRNA synthetase
MSEIKKVKPSLPSGTRDFLPQEVAKRNYIFGIIKSVFEQYGFQQIETPSMENLTTLTGKYGEEGDKLLFKILNSGDYLDKVIELQEKNENIPLGLLLTNQKIQISLITKLIAEKGLRYDLTVPLARYVVQHQNDLVFPFKRYHIAPVWRADKPQRGRYREFYQCDADIIGSNSLLNEVELTQIFSKVFSALKLNTEIRINNRKILEAIAVYADCEDKLEMMTVAIDKLDKIGIEGINNELLNKGFTDEQINKVKQVLVVKKLEELSAMFASIPVGIQGIEELTYVIKLASSPSVVFDVTLARGLNYYTGVIWEIKSLDSSMGSIGSGGRYANLTEMFGGRDMSGVGISFGVERIYDIMEELKLFPQDALKTTEILFVHFSEANRDFAFPLVQQLRNANVATELYPDKAKMEKQMKYANAKGIPYVVVIGDNEMQSGKLAVKDMRSGTQEEKTFAELLAFFTAKK